MTLTTTTEERTHRLTLYIIERHGIALNSREVAELARCSYSTVSRARMRGDLIGTRAAKNGPVRYTARAVAEWLVSGERWSV